MYCHTSSSVQFEIGNTRTCSPLRMRAVEQRPQLGPLALGIPLPEVVAEREDALLGPGTLLVAAGAAERGVEAVLVDRVEQGRRLQPVARRARPRLLDHAPLVDRLLHAGHDQPLAELLR